MTDTLYAQLARELTTGIRSGKYPVGTLLPNEMELCKTFEMSRPTVRAALAELESLGFISRRKGVGTRVESAFAASAYSQSVASLEDLTHLAAQQRRIIQKTVAVVADQALATEIDCAAGSRWTRLDLIRLGLEDDPANPTGFTRAYVTALYPDIVNVVRKSSTIMLGTIIENTYGRRIAEVEQSIRAVLMPQELTAALNVPSNTAALKIVRRYLDPAKKLVMATVTFHPGDRMISNSRLRRQSL